MARKKKKKSVNTIAYSGNVTIQVLHGNKVVSSRKVHNAGRMDLFKFIAYCLGNNYMESMAPRYLRTFNCDAKPTESNLGNQLTIGHEMSDIVAFSSITYSQSSNPDIAKVSLSFLVPGSHLINTSESKINTLCLYSTDTFEEARMSSPIAYVYLEDAQGQEDPIEFTSGVNIVIIWELSIGNATTTQQA